MKKLLLILALLLIPASASAQCNGNFGAATACGSVAGGAPGPIPFTSIAPTPCITLGGFLVGTGSGTQCSTTAGTTPIVNGPLFVFEGTGPKHQLKDTSGSTGTTITFTSNATNEWGVLMDASKNFQIYNNGLGVDAFESTVAGAITVGGSTQTVSFPGPVTFSGTTVTGSPSSPPTVFQGFGANPGITFLNTDNPGVNGDAFYLYWNQYNSAGTLRRAGTIGPGFATTTAGSEQFVYDIEALVNGAGRTVSIGGVSGGGNNFYITPADTGGYYNLGLAGQGWSKLRLENDFDNTIPPTIELDDTGQTCTNGLFRFVSSGQAVKLQQNTSVGCAFGSTASINFPSGSLSGTVAISASAPLVLNSSTGNLTVQSNPAFTGTIAAAGANFNFSGAFVTVNDTSPATTGATVNLSQAGVIKFAFGTGGGATPNFYLYNATTTTNAINDTQAGALTIGDVGVLTLASNGNTGITIATSGVPSLKNGVSCTVNTPAHLTVVNGVVTLCN